MATQREKFAKWFDSRRGPRYPQDETIALSACESFDAIEQSHELALNHLEIIVEAASSSRSLVWNSGISLLKKLMKGWPQVAEAAFKMSRSKHANVRFNALCCVTEDMPPEIADTLIAEGLKDKSARVRWKAGENAEWLNKTGLIQLLTQAADIEKTPKTQRSLVHSLRLLRDGYILDQGADGVYSFWVRIPKGYGGHSVSKAELEEKGIQRIIADFRARSS